MEAYMPFLKQLAEVSAYGFTLVAMLYYLTQAAKRAGYVPAKWVLACVGAESAVLVLTAYFVPLAFVLLVAILSLWTAVVMFHDGMKNKAGGAGPSGQ